MHEDPLKLSPRRRLYRIKAFYSLKKLILNRITWHQIEVDGNTQYRNNLTALALTIHRIHGLDSSVFMLTLTY